MPAPQDFPRQRSVLWNFKFLGTALAGSLIMALVSIFAPLPAQIAVLGACISILAGLFVAYVEQEAERERQRAELLEQLQVPIALAPEHDLFDLYSAFANSLAGLAKHPDPILRQFAILKLASVIEQVRSLAEGVIVFTSTETWRTVYEQLLQSPGLQVYRSVSWVKTADYWQDQPGRQSMRLNCFVAKQGVMIERVVILRGKLWPANDDLPSPSIRLWIDEQHVEGINLWIVREVDLINEPDLLCDFGIYDDRATGVQELDEQSRTVRFQLSFVASTVRLAQDRWTRLLLYAKDYSELLDSYQKKSRTDGNAGI